MSFGDVPDKNFFFLTFFKQFQEEPFFYICLEVLISLQCNVQWEDKQQMDTTSKSKEGGKLFIHQRQNNLCYAF